MNLQKKQDVLDGLRIDSHKLIYHVDRVSKWRDGGTIAPVYVEIAPSGACNHRCVFCALDYMKYKPVFLDTSVLKENLADAARYGVKSVMYAGEGEPLLHEDIGEIIRHTKKSGIDVAVTTNGVFFTRELARQCLGCLSWIRVSLDAGTAGTYRKIHRCREKDFETVLGNLQDAVDLRRNHKLDSVIGVQFLLIPENSRKEAVALARTLKDMGVDYLTIKPFSQHPLSRSHIDKSFKYDEFLWLEEELRRFESEKFKILFRSNTMKKLCQGRTYRHCFGLPFWAYLDARGNLYACSAYLGKKAFCYGSIYEDSFSTICRSQRRKRIIRKAASTLDVSKCREVCRLDEINRYLWELKNPSSQVNFI